MFSFRWNRVNWPNGLFLVSTLVLALTGVPLYVWRHGLDGFQVILFLVFVAMTGLSITAGYPRLFAHLTFKARRPVRLFTLVFGAAAFENSVLRWAADHRKHHKFVDRDDDYRNGVKPWQFDPTKWCIWFLRMLGLVGQLRQEPVETILLAEVAERQRQLSAKLNAAPTPISESIHRLLHAAQERVQQVSEGWERCKADYRRAAEMQREASRERRAELRRDFTDARRRLRAAIHGWQEAHRLAEAQLT